MVSDFQLVNNSHTGLDFLPTGQDKHSVTHRTAFATERKPLRQLGNRCSPFIISKLLISQLLVIVMGPAWAGSSRNERVLARFYHLQNNLTAGVNYV